MAPVTVEEHIPSAKSLRVRMLAAISLSVLLLIAGLIVFGVIRGRHIYEVQVRHDAAHIRRNTARQHQHQTVAQSLDDFTCDVQRTIHVICLLVFASAPSTGQTFFGGGVAICLSQMGTPSTHSRSMFRRRSALT